MQRENAAKDRDIWISLPTFHPFFSSPHVFAALEKRETATANTQSRRNEGEGEREGETVERGRENVTTRTQEAHLKPTAPSQALHSSHRWNGCYLFYPKHSPALLIMLAGLYTCNVWCINPFLFYFIWIRSWYNLNFITEDRSRGLTWWRGIQKKHSFQ